MENHFNDGENLQKNSEDITAFTIPKHRQSRVNRLKSSLKFTKIPYFHANKC